MDFLQHNASRPRNSSGPNSRDVPPQPRHLKGRSRALHQPEARQDHERHRPVSSRGRALFLHHPRRIPFGESLGFLKKGSSSQELVPQAQVESYAVGEIRALDRMRNNPVCTVSIGSNRPSRMRFQCKNCLIWGEKESMMTMDRIQTNPLTSDTLRSFLMSPIGAGYELLPMQIDMNPWSEQYLSDSPPSKVRVKVTFFVTLYAEMSRINVLVGQFERENN